MILPRPMGAHAAPAPAAARSRSGARRTRSLLPKLSDPRLHLAATITSLQVIGQIGFHFRLSIAQILLSLGTCARARGRDRHPEAARAHLAGERAAHRQRRRLRPARPGHRCTATGGACAAGGSSSATAAVSLLSKYVIKWRGEHIFNPSNIGLVLCFLALGRNRADPLDFWWGPMSRLARAGARGDRRGRLHDPLAAEAAAGRAGLLGCRSRPGSACSRSRATR